MISFKKKIQKIYFMLIWDGEKRAEYLKKKQILKGIGENCMFQSRNFPMDPQLLKIHNNVTIAANVTFVTHDAIRHVLMNKYEKYYSMNLGCIEIMDNVFIGLGSIICPNVRIGANSIIAAGAVVTKDVPEGSIVAGVPAKVIGKFEDLNKKREEQTQINDIDTNKEKMLEILWERFNNARGEK